MHSRDRVLLQRILFCFNVSITDAHTCIHKHEQSLSLILNQMHQTLPAILVQTARRGGGARLQGVRSTALHTHTHTHTHTYKHTMVTICHLTDTCNTCCALYRVLKACPIPQWLTQTLGNNAQCRGQHYHHRNSKSSPSFFKLNINNFLRVVPKRGRAIKHVFIVCSTNNF